MILFVGDTPSPRMNPDSTAFQGAACQKRLDEWIHTVTPSCYYIVNSVSLTDMAIINLWVTMNYPIVALGNNASKRLGDAKHFKLPHPSGRNRQINDKELIMRRLSECKLYIESFK